MSGAEQTGAGERKLLSLQDFLSIGYVQEINRRFMHPLGLMLAIVVDESAGSASICVFDFRDDPEGCCFAGDLMKDQDALDKAARVRGMEDIRRDRRKKSLGYWIQPIGETALEQFASDPMNAERLKYEARILELEEEIARMNGGDDAPR